MKIVAGILLVLATLASLPYLLYWLLWLLTGRGLPPKTAGRPERKRTPRRTGEVWALKTVALMAVAVAIYVATMYLWVRYDFGSY